MKKIFLAFFGIIFAVGAFSPISAIKVAVPDWDWESDVIVPLGEEIIETDEKHIFDIIQIINKYLRFSIGAICMVLLIFAGIRLISANWNEEVIKKTSNLLTGALVGLAISILSWAAVRLLVNIL